MSNINRNDIQKDFDEIDNAENYGLFLFAHEFPHAFEAMTRGLESQPERTRKRVVIIQDCRGVTHINPEWLDTLVTQDDFLKGTGRM